MTRWKLGKSFSPRLMIAASLFSAWMLWSPGTAQGASPDNLPVVDGKRVVARVGGEPIFWDEFERALAVAHAEAFTDPKRRMEGGAAPKGIDFAPILKRLVDVRLILREAGNMGLDALPEVEDALAANARETLAAMLLERHVKDIRVEESEVRDAYRNEARQWKLKSALFKKEEDAEQAAQRIAGGADFNEEIQAATSAGIATVDVEGRFLKRSEINPAVGSVLADMTVGQVSPVIPLKGKGFVLFRVEEVRDPEMDDPAALQKTRSRLLKEKRTAAATEYYRELRERYATVDQELLDALDYESETPGIEALRKDGRVLVKLKGEKPVTVSDLTAALEKKFFHGFARAAEGKRVNSRKEELLESILEKRILVKEARKLGLDRTDEYALRVSEFKNAMIFGTFVDKAVAPDIRIHPEELQEYYDDHREEFASPVMMRIQSIAFDNRDKAFEAVEKLSAGTDFEWFSTHAEGQVAGNAPNLLRFDGSLVTQTSLPEDVQDAVEGAATGDYKLYSDPENGYDYVLRMQQVFAPRVQPLEAVTKEIVPILYRQKIKDAIDEWTQQLKRHYPVDIYLTSLE